ncbi:MAG: flavin reductase family protein [Candidatus Altiarchaeota archaeon]|nr:flavin reductase family protein [Candidatus Altiarchaeota archaeon]
MKKNIGPATIVHPHPVFVVGSFNREGKPNMMAVSWGGICCSKPPCVAVSVRKETQTYRNIIQSKAFTVNIPSEEHVKEVDYVGIACGADTDKFRDTKLTPVESELVHAPIVEEFPYALECKLLKTVEIGLHTQFIGEILGIIAEEKILGSHGKPDIEKVKPLIYGSFGNRGYYGIGVKLGDAFSIGKEYITE